LPRLTWQGGSYQEVVALNIFGAWIPAPRPDGQAGTWGGRLRGRRASDARPL